MSFSLISRIALAVALGAAANAASAAVPDGVSYALHLKLVWVCAAVAALAYAVMVHGLATARCRGVAGKHGRRAELLWAVLPAVILIGLAAPAIGTLAHLAADDPGAVIAAGP